MTNKLFISGGASELLRFADQVFVPSKAATRQRINFAPANHDFPRIFTFRSERARRANARRLTKLAEKIVEMIHSGKLDQNELQQHAQVLAQDRPFASADLVSCVERALARHALVRLADAHQGRIEAKKAAKTASSIEAIATDAADVLGPRDHAIAWLKSVRLPTLGNATPEELVNQGLDGVVLGMLDELRYGSRG